MDPHQHERFVELDRAGLSAAEIAQRFGVSQRTVTRWRSQSGRVKQPADRRPDSDRAKAQELLDDGCCLAEIARTLGVSHTTVARWLPDGRRCTKTEAGEIAVLHRYELWVMRHLRHERQHHDGAEDMPA